ncbi:MAG: hypothetical protein HOP18_25525 [Deltaproteobacteria bacterium]|nr:hypothetical protein [Deltaproteobacteria bacterium]
MRKRKSRLAWCGAVAVVGLLGIRTPSISVADQVIADDLVVQGKTCSGTGCVNTEIFGLENMLLKQPNNRIRFDDTSIAVGDPANDWQITVNDNVSGGLNRFSIDDLTGAKTPFTILAGAPNSAIFVNSLGDVGFGTATPVVELHVMDSNTPHLRLEQDGTGGFSPRAWDMGANESYLFIRDFTSDTFPFRILAGAPDHSLHIASNGRVGLGTDAPEATLHINGGSTQDVFSGVGPDPAGNSGTGALNFGYSGSTFGSGSGFFNVRPTTGAIAPNPSLRFGTGNTQRMIITNLGRVGIGTTAPADLLHVNGGNIRVQGGSFIDDGTTLNVPDYVFEPTYKLLPLPELAAYVEKEKHLPEIPSAQEIQERGINLGEMQLRLLKKVEELTLYTIQQAEQLRQQAQMIQAQQQALTIQQQMITELHERQTRMERQFASIP